MSGHGRLLSYVTGFVLSIVLTLLAYVLIVHHVLAGWTAIAIVVTLAVVQLFAQLIFFLHLGKESASTKSNLLVFDFMLLVLAILVFGSLWIMNNLNYHMMTPAQTDTYIVMDEGVHQ